MTTTNEILKLIKSIRKNKKITTTELAQALSLSQSSYSRIELGQQELSLDGFLKICEALEIEPSYFFNSISQNKEITTKQEALSLIESAIKYLKSTD